MKRQTFFEKNSLTVPKGKDQVPQAAPLYSTPFSKTTHQAARPKTGPMSSPPKPPAHHHTSDHRPQLRPPSTRTTMSLYCTSNPPILPFLPARNPSCQAVWESIGINSSRMRGFRRRYMRTISRCSLETILSVSKHRQALPGEMVEMRILGEASVHV